MMLISEIAYKMGKSSLNVRRTEIHNHKNSPFATVQLEDVVEEVTWPDMLDRAGMDLLYSVAALGKAVSPRLRTPVNGTESVEIYDRNANDRGTLFTINYSRGEIVIRPGCRRTGK